MSTRVIAGTAKGTRLQLVPGDSTRPIMDKVKESLFNIIGTAIQDSYFFDLFGGTGAVAIEALSRGADYALITEKNRAAIDTIQANLRAARLHQQADVWQADIFDVLKRPPNHEYHFLYVAPPQYLGMWDEVVQAIDDNPAWLSPETIVIVQIDPSEQRPVLYRHLRDYDQRRYGKTLLWFFEATLD